MSNLIAAMARFSTGMTLFGMEQMEKTMNVVSGEQNLSKVTEELENTLNQLTDVLTGKMDEKKKETVQSVTKMTEDTINRTMDGMHVLDPREVMKASTDFMQKTSDVTANWVSKAASAVEKATGTAKTEEPAAESVH